jgi:hypothetical protein
MKDKRKRARHERAQGRVRLVPAGSLSSSQTKHEAQWMLLPKDPVFVADIIRRAADCLQISSTSNLQLRLDGAVLQPDQPADLVRDGDTLTIVQLSRVQRRSSSARPGNFGSKLPADVVLSVSDEDSSSESSSSSSSSDSSSMSGSVPGSSSSSSSSTSSVHSIEKSDRVLRGSVSGQKLADPVKSAVPPSAEKRNQHASVKPTAQLVGSKRKLSQAKRKSRNRRNRRREKRRKRSKNGLAAASDGLDASSNVPTKAPATKKHGDINGDQTESVDLSKNALEVKRNSSLRDSGASPSEFKDIPVSRVESPPGVESRNMLAASNLPRAGVEVERGTILPNGMTANSLMDSKIEQNGVSGPYLKERTRLSTGIEGLEGGASLGGKTSECAARIPKADISFTPVNGNAHPPVPSVGNQGKISSVSGILERLKRIEPARVEPVMSTAVKESAAVTMGKLGTHGKRKKQRRGPGAKPTVINTADHRFLTESQTNASVLIPEQQKSVPLPFDTWASSVHSNVRVENVISTNYMLALNDSLDKYGLAQIQCGLRVVGLGHAGSPQVSEWIMVILKPDASSESLLIHRSASRKAVDLIIGAGGRYLDLHPPDFPLAIDATALYGLIVYEPSSVVSRPHIGIEGTSTSCGVSQPKLDQLVATKPNIPCKVEALTPKASDPSTAQVIAAEKVAIPGRVTENVIVLSEQAILTSTVAKILALARARLRKLEAGL